MKKLLLLGGMTALMSVSFAPEAQAGKCQSVKRPKLDKENICSVMDTKNDISKSKYLYKNPNTEGCDLGLQMPGLPGFGFDVGDFDLCSTLQYVTEDVVAEINDYTQGAVDSAIDSATGGYGTQISIDPNAAAQGAVNGSGAASGVNTNTGSSSSENTKKLLDVLKKYNKAAPSAN